MDEDQIEALKDSTVVPYFADYTNVAYLFHDALKHEQLEALEEKHKRELTTFVCEVWIIFPHCCCCFCVGLISPSSR